MAAKGPIKKRVRRPAAATTKAGAPFCHTSAPQPSPDPELLKRLSRIEGQIRGISGMVQDGRYCIDVLTQIAAVHEALRAAARGMVKQHMHTCVATAMLKRDPAEADRVSREMAQLLDRFTR